MLEVDQLTKRYAAIPAVDNVSFTIRPGEILGYIGPNGSGKTTTVKMLTGLLRPSAGHVFFQGKDINDDLAGYKRRLGYVPEEPALYTYLSGIEYLELTGTLRGIPESLLEAKIDRLLSLLSLHSARYSLISSYSKGMRQRLLIAASLIHNPDLIIFDEPLSGLDVTSAMIFRDLLRELASDGKCILYCSHVLEVVEKVSSHVLILNHGKRLAYDEVANLRDLMALSSLEEVFSELVTETDTAEAARSIVDAMKQQ